MNNNVCATIISYNTGEDIKSTIDAIKDQVAKLLLIDNGSDEKTITILKDYETQNSNIELILNESNLGIAAALNIAARYAVANSYSWLLTLDDDSTASDSMVEALLKTASKVYNNLGIISPKQWERDRASELSYDMEEIREVTIDMTSGNLVNCEVFKTVGFYNEDFFIDFVDHEFCLRLIQNNYKIIKANNIILWHSLGESKTLKLFGKELTVTNHSPVRRYYITRNRLYCWNSFKADFPSWVKEDKGRFRNETIKILLYEDKKIKKLKMIYKGILDYKNGISGSLKY